MTNDTNHKPDEICEIFANKNVKIKLKLLDKDMLLVEGTANDLEFLGQLCLSVARGTRDTGFQISPNGPGQRLFSEESSLGIYIHRSD